MLIALLLAAVQPPGVDPAAAEAVRLWTLCLTQSAERLTVAGADADAVAASAVAACAASENEVVATTAPPRGPAADVHERLRGRARAFIANRTRTRLASIARDPVAAANQAHGGCIGERVGLDATSTSRPAAAIIDEAYAACRPQEERLRAALTAARGRLVAETLIAEIIRSGRESAAELVAATRRGRNAR